MYGGEVKLTFSPRQHRYYIEDRGKEVKCPSVTTVCNIVDKPFLIPWAVNKCLDVCRGAVRPGEIYPEVYLDQVWEVARRAHRDIKEEAGAIGTAVHTSLEAIFRGLVTREQVSYQQTPAVEACIGAACDWLAEHKVEPIEIERRIYSRYYHYTGTLDKIALVDGQICLIDWKSSKSIHKDYWMQTAAYCKAYTEETGTPVVKRYLIHMDKITGVPTPHMRKNKGDLVEDFNGFKAALKLHNYIRGN